METSSTLTVPEYIHDVLYDMGGIKGKALHALVDAAIQRDGKVPSQPEWENAIDAASDDLSDLDFDAKYPEVSSVIQDFFIR